MSGAEVAGLVLAILPLCVSALEHYRDELRPFKSLFRYHKEIQRSAEDLGVAYVGFVQTIHLVFEEAGIADPDQLDRSTYTSANRQAGSPSHVGDTCSLTLTDLNPMHMYCLVLHNC